MLIYENENVIFEGNENDFIEDYKNLIESCRGKQNTGYVEVHHILPRCMGGTDDKDNLIELEVKDHIIAHILLAKAYPSNYKIVYAAMYMISATEIKRDISEKTFSITELTNIRENARKSRIGEGNPMFGRKQSDDTKKLISKINTGRKFTKEQSEAHSIKMKNRIITDEWKNNISKGLIGKKHPHKSPTYTPEERQRRAETARRNATLGKRKIQAPDGTVYESISDCSRETGISLYMLSKYLYKTPNSGYKFL